MCVRAPAPSRPTEEPTNQVSQNVSTSSRSSWNTLVRSCFQVFVFDSSKSPTGTLPWAINAHSDAVSQSSQTYLDDYASDSNHDRRHRLTTRRDTSSFPLLYFQFATPEAPFCVPRCAGRIAQGVPTYLRGMYIYTIIPRRVGLEYTCRGTGKPRWTGQNTSCWCRRRTCSPTRYLCI